MRIAVNTRLMLSGGLDGIGWFSSQCMRRISKANPECEFHFIFDRPWDESFITSVNITPHYINPPARHPLLFYLWYEWAIPRLLNKINPDLFVSLDGMGSLRWKSSPQLPVMHDINFKHYPEGLPYSVRTYYNYFLPRYAQKAKRIATVSEYSKQDIASSFQVNQEKIDVVYSASNGNYKPICEEEKKAIRNKYSKGKPYFVFIGTLIPRKNISRLLQAYDLFRQEQETDVQLMLVGNKKWWTSEMQNTLQNTQFHNDVIFPGFVPTEDLEHILASALGLTFVPYFEGFGVPPLEAMQCGVPVISSNKTAMPEIAGDAALIVDPFDISSIKNAMLRIANDASLRNSLIEKGHKRCLEFTWDKTAELLWQSMQKCLQ